MNRNLRAASSAFAVAFALAACVQNPAGPVRQAFDDASDRTGVPAPLLMAIGYTETRLRTPEVLHGGGALDEEHSRGQVGLMGVLERADRPWLSEGARRAGVDVELAHSDARANILAAAHVLSMLAFELGVDDKHDLAAWQPVLVAWGGEGNADAGAAYAADVFAHLERGGSAVADGGELVVWDATELDVAALSASSSSLTQGLVADSALVNRTVDARFFTNGRSANLDTVVIHTTEGSYAGTISWFTSPSNPYSTSAHYVIRSSDGQITQMVREQNTAHHVRNYNSRSIGIEHEAISAQASWFTDVMYRRSAALTRDITGRRGIARTRSRIIGHVEAPGNDHTDPGPHWNWSYYMSLVNDPNAPEPDFCDSHNGTWCHGDDVVVCVGGNESSRTDCEDGCRTMPAGTPDRCNRFCEAHSGTWCDGNDVVTCTNNAEAARTPCANGCRTMPAGTPDQCAAGPATGTLRGVIFEDVGVGSADMTRRLQTATFTIDTGAARAVTGADAEWSVSIAAGARAVTARAPGFENATRSCTVTAGQTTWCSIGLVRVAAEGEGEGEPAEGEGEPAEGEGEPAEGEGEPAEGEGEPAEGEGEPAEGEGEGELEPQLVIVQQPMDVGGGCAQTNAGAALPLALALLALRSRRR